MAKAMSALTETARQMKRAAKVDPSLRICLATTLTLGLLLAPFPALAVPPRATPGERTTTRVLFRAATAQDWQLATRIRGQTSDLPLELVEVPTPFLEERLRDQFRAAEALGDQTKASVIVWRTRAAVFAFVTAPAPGYVVQRKLGPQAAGDPSAFLEETALVTRTLLRAVVEGALPRQTKEEILSQEEPAAATASAAPAVGPPWRAALDGHFARLDDGLGAAWGYGAAAGLVRDGSAWLLGVDWYATRDKTTIYADTVHFKRYAFFAQASSRFWRPGFVSLRAIGRVQMIVTQIGLLSEDTGLEDRVNRFRPVLTPAVDVSVPLSEGRVVLRVELGVEVMPDPPALRTVRNGVVVEAIGPRVLTPRVAAGVEVAWP